jgi:putative signal transducing protein
MESNDEVVVTVVADEAEADVVCGLLRSAGIECAYRETEKIDSLLEEFTPSGPREILVRASDMDAARALLSRPAG